MTDVEICNLALQRIGQLVPITSLDPGTDDSESAAVCAVAYPTAKRALLMRFPWGFATAQGPLTRVGGDATTDSGWMYRYALPTAFLKGQGIYAGARPGQMLRVINGQLCRWDPVSSAIVPQLPYEVRGGNIYADVLVPPLWTNATTYALGDVVYYAGAHWTSSAAGNLNHAPAAGSAYWTAAASQPSFVYTTEAGEAAFTPLFCDALAWGVAADLALAKATKPQLAQMFRQEAERTFRMATTDQLTGRNFDPPPTSRFISGRR